MKKTRFRLPIILAVFFMLALLAAGMVSPACSPASAESSARTAYESSNVLEDLRGVTIKGKPFSATDFPYRENGEPQVLSLVEFCYSYSEEKQTDFGLYLYLYNPAQTVFDTATTRNKIQLRAGKQAVYAKYALRLLNVSTETGTEGRFLKFAISLSDSERTEILHALNAQSRTYDVSGIELSARNTVTEYACAQVHKYGGYAKGYGENAAAESTLSYTVDGYERILDFNVFHTVYRPKGDFYNGEQSQLNSCFFRVPNEYFELYGQLTALMCEWYEYRTKPALVTEDKTIYNALNELNGAPLSSLKNGYLALQAFGNNMGGWLTEPGWTIFDWASNVDLPEDYWGMSGLEKWYGVFPATDRFDRLSGVFYSPDDYMAYSVNAEIVKAELLEISNALGGNQFADRYSSDLFSDLIDPGHKRGYSKVSIKADDRQDIFWTSTTKEWWQHIFHGLNVETEYDSMQAIVSLTAKDLNGSDSAVAETLRINAGDVPKLRAEFAAAGNNERVILLRFGTSQYFSAPCAAYYCTENQNMGSDTVEEWLARRIYWQKADRDICSYLSWQTVYLDFDVISLTFTDENAVEVVIPVVSSPTDAIGGIDPPLAEESGFNFWEELKDFVQRLFRGDLKWWEWIIVALAVPVLILAIVLIIYLFPLIVQIVKSIIWLFITPFKLLGKAIQSASRRREKRKRAKAQKQKNKNPENNHENEKDEE